MVEKFPGEQNEEQVQEEQAEKLDDVIKIDSYLETLRQKEEKKKDEAEQNYEKKVRRSKPRVDEKLIAETKKSIKDMMENDSAQLYDAAAAKKAAETKKSKEVILPQKEAKKPHLIPSLINAVFLKPSKKFAKETWGLIKRGKKLFGMTAILGLAHIGASASPKVATAPKDSLKTKDSVEKTASYEAPLSAQVKQEWNEFIDWMNAEAKEDPTLVSRLNHDQLLGKKMLEQFVAEHPGAAVTFEMVGRIQREILKFRESVQDFEKRHGRDGSDLLNSASKEDNWIGKNTLSIKFARSTMVYPGGTKKDFGLINGDLTSDKTYALRANLPAGVDLIKEKDGGYTYVDPNSGDIKRIPPGTFK